ncbi:hypothetical protein KC322_g133 [Hortaea werneckii]|nr:hypothetical protein KC322_g133 [Hortaea werneckii]
MRGRLAVAFRLSLRHTRVCLMAGLYSCSLASRLDLGDTQRHLFFSNVILDSHQKNRAEGGVMGFLIFAAMILLPCGFAWGGIRIDEQYSDGVVVVQRCCKEGGMRESQFTFRGVG